VNPPALVERGSALNCFFRRPASLLRRIWHEIAGCGYHFGNIVFPYTYFNLPPSCVTLATNGATKLLLLKKERGRANSEKAIESVGNPLARVKISIGAGSEFKSAGAFRRIMVGSTAEFPDSKSGMEYCHSCISFVVGFPFLSMLIEFMYSNSIGIHPLPTSGFHFSGIATIATAACAKSDDRFLTKNLKTQFDWSVSKGMNITPDIEEL
jgi:hypothetical protein